MTGKRGRVALAWPLIVCGILSACVNPAPAPLAESRTIVASKTTKPLKVLPAKVVSDGEVVSLPYKSIENAMNDLALRAFDLVQTNYRYGGNNPNEGFDCSGFVSFLYQETLGVNLPRTTRDMKNVGKSISAKQLQTGDLVFFNTLRRPFSHVGVYIGEGRFIHAPRQGKAVQIVNMDNVYWQNRFNGAKRVVETDNSRIAKE